MPEPSKTKVGLIGLGLMGTALADRLRAAGFEVVGHDASPEAQARFAESGREVAPLDCFDFDRIVFSLPNHEVVARVVAALPDLAGRILIDTTTGDPTAAADLALKLKARGVSYLDATISGSSEHVRRGDAVLMVGGRPEAHAACADLFESIAKKTFHTGEVGSGAKLKLVTNLVLGLNRAALGEGLAYAIGLGLDPRQVFSILLESPAYSKIMETKGPKMLAAEYAPQAKLAQHLKDVRLMIESAEAAGMTLPLTEAHRGILEQAVAEGLSDLDNSALFEVLKPRSRPS